MLVVRVFVIGGLTFGLEFLWGQKACMISLGIIRVALIYGVPEDEENE